MTDTPAKLPIIIMTESEKQALINLLDNPFISLNELQQALFERGYKLVKL